MTTASPSSKLVLLTGLSGSGKSVVLKALEDTGYFCVDNLPIGLLEGLVQTLRGQGHQRMAVAADARGAVDAGALGHTLDAIRASGVDLTVLFLTARSDILVQRYSETRRRHPLSLTADQGLTDGRSLAECIEAERELLADYATLGTAFDTSDLGPSGLRAWVRELLSLKASPLTLLFQSFAYKEGVPLDADLVFDVRCLPNPFYDNALRGLTGKDTKVIRFLEDKPSVGTMVTDIQGFLERWLPHYQTEHRSYLTVALGCTGGQHRSVYCAEALSKHFSGAWPVMVRHRSLIRRGLD
ncbi:MAG: RNase adapter RapZ [Burkholderiaceae bacterium]|jgi:UPF0042 nucleotide-binding protein